MWSGRKGEGNKIEVRRDEKGPVYLRHEMKVRIRVGRKRMDCMCKTKSINMKELMVGITRAEGDKKNRNSQPWVSLGLKLGKGRSEYQGIEDEKEIEVKNFSSQLRVRARVKEYRE